MKKKTTILLAVLALMLVSVGTFAYWASKIKGVEKDKGVTIGIGVGQEVETTLDITEGENSEIALVPAGYEDGVSSVNSKDVKVTLKWVGKGLSGVKGTYNITFVEAKINGVKSDIASDLLTIDYDKTDLSIIGNEDKEVTVKVSFKNEPKDSNEYSEVAGKNIEIVISVSVTPEQK